MSKNCVVCGSPATGGAWQGYHAFDGEILAWALVCEDHTEYFDTPGAEEYGRSYGYIPGILSRSEAQAKLKTCRDNGNNPHRDWQKRSGRSRRHRRKLGLKPIVWDD